MRSPKADKAGTAKAACAAVDKPINVGPLARNLGLRAAPSSAFGHR